MKNQRCKNCVYFAINFLVCQFDFPACFLKEYNPNSEFCRGHCKYRLECAGDRLVDDIKPVSKLAANWQKVLAERDAKRGDAPKEENPKLFGYE